MGPSRAQVIEILKRLREGVSKEDCWTCDCLQGLLTQLELDADEDITDLTADLKITRDLMHGCLGCDPCPPGNSYANYLRKRTCNNDNKEQG